MKRVSLAQLPTPVQPLRRLSTEFGVNIDIKRDDLTGLGLSGNKVRKLEFLLADACAQGAKRVVTCGGLQSNHCRATAVASRMLGLEPVLLLRGSPAAQPNGNLLLNRLLGAEIHFCDAAEYRLNREARMAELAPDAYLIPEGGSNALGASSYAAATEEIDGRYDAVVVAVGSGGTAAGLGAGVDIGPVKGVAVCDDRAFFEARIATIVAEDPALQSDRIEIVEGFQGPGYAVADAEVWATIAHVARLEGILLDPVYTGKAMHALLSKARAGQWGGKILFWHTGGAFGLFGRGDECPV